MNAPLNFLRAAFSEDAMEAAGDFGATSCVQACCKSSSLTTVRPKWQCLDGVVFMVRCLRCAKGVMQNLRSFEQMSVVSGGGDCPSLVHWRWMTFGGTCVMGMSLKPSSNLA